MAKKRIPTSKPKNKAVSDFINEGIDQSEESKEQKKSSEPAKRGRKPKDEEDKYQRYNFTFPPEFIEDVDTFLKKNPYEGSNRSGFFHRIISLYMNSK